jgi:hypothetical protein
MAPTTTATATTASTTTDRPTVESPAGPVRLTLKNGTTSGHVDGAWWPRSTNLEREIPGMLAALADRIHVVDRVSYDLAAWDPATRRLSVGNRAVRLDGFRGRRPSDTVNIVGVDRAVVTLLVVPPATEADEAAAILSRTTATDSRKDTVAVLLGGAAEAPEQRRAAF